jgi:hypothetical protein
MGTAVAKSGIVIASAFCEAIPLGGQTRLLHSVRNDGGRVKGLCNGRGLMGWRFRQISCVHLGT